MFGGYTETYRIPLVANKTFYRLSFHNATLGDIKDAWLINRKHRVTQTDLVQLRTQNLRWMEHSGYPDQYFQIGADVIGLHPKPSATSDVLELHCMMIPAPYSTDADRIKVRQSFRWAVVHYVVAEYYAGRGDAQTATRHLQQYGDVVGMRHLYRNSPSGRMQTQKTEEPRPEPPF